MSDKHQAEPSELTTGLSEDEKRAKRLKAGIGIGIGSAAIVAALLYTNRSNKKKSDKPKD